MARDLVNKRKYQREWIKSRRTKYFLENGPCVKCGSDKDLQLDHINPETKITHRIWSRSEEFRNKELAKCQILCKDCHRLKSNKDLSKIFTNKPNYKVRKYSKEFIFKIFEDYFNNGLSRRKVAKKHNIPQATLCTWIYEETYKDLLIEFKSV